MKAAYPGDYCIHHLPEAKEGYAMKENTVIAFRNPADFQEDPLTEVLQAGARKLLTQAVEAEATLFLDAYAAFVDDAGRRRVVRNGHLPERAIQTGIGPVSVRQPRVRDRGDGAIRFTSAILPRYLRRTKSLEDLLPWLYLKGISTGDFSEALAALLGAQAPGLSASTISRLKEVWGVEAERWQRRDLTAKRYVYFWVDGIYFSARMEEEKQCILVVIGATEAGQKELLAITDGYRESAQSWRELLLDLKRRGLVKAPELAIGDGALGFWKALREVYGKTREQRCWVHKTGNVLNELPKGLQKKAKQHLHDIWMAETRKEAESAFDFFLEAYGAKYDKAAACLAKDRDVLLTFYDFPAKHWKHIRTTNPIESTFATVRLRTYRTKGCLSRKTAMAMVFKLCQCAQRKWRKLDGSNHLAEIIRGVKFVDGERQDRAAA
jgi:transposase-like protein